MNVNYQEVVTLAIAFITMALPIGIVLGVTERIVRFFISAVSGDKNIKL
jgi:hypothetical protein